MSSHMLRTLVFAGIAVVCVAGAVLTNTVTRGKPLDDTALVGQEFFPDLEGADVTALQVATYDEDSADVNLFKVEFSDGLWRIPSHHDYPADGEELLAKTAASVVGLTRGAFAGKTEADQRRTSTLDPLDESITGTEGRGDRITLFRGNTPVVDLIVGERTDDEAGDVYYVREAGDPKIYRTRMSELKVSTKFADWIESDLLQLDRNKLVEMTIDRYHIDEQQGAIIGEEVTELKKNDENKWELVGLDAETEELKTSAVTAMTSALDDMKIVGVRPKPSGLVKLLTSEDGRVSLSDIEIIQMRNSMSRAGFVIAQQQIYSNEGEFRAGTNEGVVYQLRFGEVFTGSDVEIEVGSSAEPDAEETDAESADEGADETQNDAESQDDSESSDDGSAKRSRYLLVMAQFDESLLGDAPQPPVKPEPPGEEPEPEADEDEPAESDTPADDDSSNPDAGEKPAEESSENEDAQPEENAEPESGDESAATEDEESEDDPPAEETPEAEEKPEADSSDGDAPSDDAGDDPEDAAEDAAEKPAEEPVDPQEAYKEALAAYEDDLAKYEADKAAFDEKVKQGREQVAELNRRFAAWYYVISAELFDDLHVARADLVEAKEPAEGEEGAAETEGDETGDATPEPDAEDDTKSEADADESADDPQPASEDQPADEDKAADESTSEAEKNAEDGGDPKSEADSPSEADDTAE